MKTFTVTLVRHGKVNGASALYGSTDVEVSPETNQAICNSLANADIHYKTVISSPLRRCLSLAELLAGEHLLVCEPALKEMYFGQLDGTPFEEITSVSEEWQQLEQFWHNPASSGLPDAESLENFSRRVTACWTRIVSELQHDVLIITHGGVIRAIVADVLGLDWKNPKWYSNLTIRNGSITQIQVTMADNEPYFSVKQIGSTH
ncbi:histidine phosphatase family protein [Photobacterium sp. CAU 1568]|uniref:Histidine phosphatase family protein n=1 Tax=Photobacterium arenosum TaxID=2774143 RepID=A0ABR9BFN9_9GAMM|nr:histidine phosphatase family protein [Photobacterium arenosum]